MRALAIAVLLSPLAFLMAFVGGLSLATTSTSATSSTTPTTAAGGMPAASYTVATLNILGASHTDGDPGHGLGGHENTGWPGWRTRLPGALAKLTQAGVTIAGLQEVHAPQSRALDTTCRERWGMFPRDASVADKVIWDRRRWRLTESRRVKLPYFYGHMVDTPLVQLTSIDTGQVVWVWSIHNPIGASRHRVEALDRELRTVSRLAATGVPVVLVGDFNDATDSRHRSAAVLTPTMLEAHAGAPGSIDHLYGAHVTWLGTRVDHSTQTQQISDHPLVTATWKPTLLPTASSAVTGAGAGG